LFERLTPQQSDLLAANNGLSRLYVGGAMGRLLRLADALGGALTWSGPLRGLGRLWR
jgi:hypothetical protein